MARERLDLTQAEVGVLFEVRRATVNGYEGKADAPLGYLSLLAGEFEGYHAVFRWLRDGGLRPRLVPRGLGTEGLAGDPRLVAWARVEAEMDDYERRGESAPSAQLAHWLDMVRVAATSTDGDEAAHHPRMAEALLAESERAGTAQRVQPPPPDQGSEGQG